MTIKEIREKTTETLGLELQERRKHLFDLKSQAVTEKLEDPSQLGKTRKDIARVKTILRQRELEGRKGPESGAKSQKPKTAAKKPKAVKKTAKTTTKGTKRVKRTTKAKA